MKRFLYLISGLMLSLSVPGCQDMDLIPKDSISDLNYWKTPEDFKMALNTLYNNALQSFSDYNTDIDSDIAYALGPNEISNGTWIAADDDAFWKSGFENLRQANLILQKVSEYEGDKKEIEIYEAEARFFRAYIYYRLMLRFNDVPIITKVLDVNDSELYGKRDPRSAVEDFILEELESIKGRLPLKSDLASEDIGRITQGAALALKARVALFAGTWAKYHGSRPDSEQLLDCAIAAAKEVIDSKEYSLFEGKGGESYRYLFIEEGDDSPEDILSSRYYTDIRTHSASSQFAWGFNGTPTKQLADMYLCKSTGLPISDPESGFAGYEKIADEFKDRDPRMLQTFLIPGTVYNNFEQTGTGLVCAPQFSTRPETRTGYKLWKFMGEKKGTDTQADYDYHIIRYAEVLLILAEATFERYGAIDDATLDRTINEIRGREGVDMPPLTNEFAVAHGLDMLTEIRRERTVELAFEGFRRDDLRRWKTAETILPEDIKGIKYKGSEYESLDVLNNGNPGLVDSDGFLIVEPGSDRHFVDPKHYFYPLPMKQLNLNPNLNPNNPGW